jgi:AcrR family transcriptional regulator
MAPTREELTQATRSRVLDVAGRQFQEHGFAATTVRDVAAAAGVSVGTVMAVGDKSALLVQVFDSLIAAEHDRRISSVPSTASAAGDGAGGGPDAGTCADRAGALVQPFVALFTGSPELSRTYASILVSGAHASTLFTDLAAQLTDEFAAAITLRGCTAQAEAPVRAQALHAAYVGTLFTWSTRGTDDPSGLTDRLRAVFAAVCACKE